MQDDESIPFDSIYPLIEYLEKDEAKHFLVCHDEGTGTENHIYRHVRAVRAWLNSERPDSALPCGWAEEADQVIAAETERSSTLN